MGSLADSGRPALFCAVSIGAALVGIPLLRGALGPRSAVSAGFALAAAVALVYWATRHPVARGRFVAGGIALGTALFPFLCVVVGGVGLLLGLEPVHPATGFRGSNFAWLNALLLAPIFEEVLYRSLLIDLLRPRIGLHAAFAVSAVLFAVSHISPWSIVGGFVVGSLLSAVMARTGRLDLCVGLHAGLNLASLGLGTPPPSWTIVASLALLGAGAVALPRLLGTAWAARL
jgi:membrane protease YdiL (CAAX protease family)